MDSVTFILIFTATFMAIFGTLTARSSIRREKILSGPAAQLFNLIGTIAFVGILPGVLCSLALGQTHIIGFPMAVTLLVTSLLAFLIFAVFELPVRKANQSKVVTAEEEEVWTAEKARTSGL
jgi:hypothetical protein